MSGRRRVRVMAWCGVVTALGACANTPDSSIPNGTPVAPLVELVDTIKVGPNPAGIVATSGAVYIANNNQTGPSSVGMLLHRDPTPYLSEYRQTPDIEGSPSSFAGTYNLALSPDGKQLYALNSGISAALETISVLDTATRQFATPLTGFNAPDVMAIMPDGKSAYVANYGFYNYKTVDVSKVDSTVVLVDLGSGEAVKKIAVQRGPDAFALSADARTLYCANVYDNSVSVIDTRTNTVRATVTDKTILGPFTIALSRDGRSLYITNYGNPLFPGRTDNTTVSVMDTATDTITKAIAVGKKPSGIALTPDGRFAYVTNYESPGSVSVIDLASASVVQTLPVGNLPSEIAIDPAGAYAYVTNLKDNPVSVLRSPR